MPFPEPGATWAGLHIEAQIGAGDRGRVYVAEDPDTGSRVALEVLDPEHTDQADRERFTRDVRAAAGVDHPRVLPILRFGEHDGAAFAVTRYLDGGDVASALGQGPLSSTRTLAVVDQVASALDAAHEQGLVHGDVVPANVVCADDGDAVYLTGFGWREGRDARDDVRALGALAFECFTGRLPAAGADHLDEADRAGVATVSRYRPDLPSDLDAVVARALSPDPAERHPSAGSLAAALHDVVAGAGGRPPHPAPVPRFEIDGPADDPSGSGGGRSVFDDPPDGPPVGDHVPQEPTAPVPTAAPEPDPAVREIQVEWDGWEDEEEPAGPRSPVPYFVAGVVALVVIGVGLLVYRAANTDGGPLPAAGGSTTTSEPDATTPSIEPTIGALEDLLPDGAGDCAAAPEGVAPEGAVQIACTRTEAPDLLTFTLFPDGTERDQAFVDVVGTLDIAGAGDGECALGDQGVNSYAAPDGAGQVGCRIVGRRADLVWTRADAPVLGTAGGEGAYGEIYAVWADLVGRTDDGFPMPAEQALLDRLPEQARERCRRDLGLTLAADGTVAVACEPDGEPEVVSTVAFAGPESMRAWLDARQSSLPGPIDTADDACDSGVFGRPGEGDEAGDDGGSAAGVVDYEVDGSTGRLLCFVNTSDQNVLFWIREGEDLGSIAVSPAGSGPETMDELLRWWLREGFLP